MQFGRSFTSSAYSLPSPDGAYIATVLPAKLTIRETRSLEVIRQVALPPELCSALFSFLWSPSSQRILLASGEVIRVFSPTSPRFSATITNPTAGTAKITSITFGATDNEINVFADFGLKLTVFNVSTSRSVEILCPKFYTLGSAPRGYSYRPHTGQLALLTRQSGKDIVSIHARGTQEVTRSWITDTIDAHGMSWSPDGKWLAVWESAGQGHKILFYTTNGHLYKIWNGPTPSRTEEDHSRLGPGVKLFEWNASAELVAVGDHSSNISLLSAPSFSETLKFCHNTTIKPIDGQNVWQEQIKASQNGRFERQYVRISQVFCPPVTTSTPAASSIPSARSGTSNMAFDRSGTLLASKSENMPTGVWIWDTKSRLLTSILIQHAPVAKFTWHPSRDQLLMIRCEGDDEKAFVHLWEPSWESPRIVNFASQMPEGKLIGRSVARWLNAPFSAATIFFSDTQNCLLASIDSEDAEEQLPWGDAVPKGVDIYGQREESPLDLVSSGEKKTFGSFNTRQLYDEDEDTITKMSGDTVEIDDTFRFRKC